MGRSAIASISLPMEMAQEVDKLARREHKTKSGVIQDAVRSYVEERKWRGLQMKVQAKARRLKIESDDDIEALVDEVRL